MLIVILEFQKIEGGDEHEHVEDLILNATRSFFCLFNVEVAEIFVRRRRVFSAKLAKIFHGSQA